MDEARLLTAGEFIKNLAKSVKSSRVFVLRGAADSDDTEAFGILQVEFRPQTEDYRGLTYFPKLIVTLKTALPTDDPHVGMDLKVLLQKQALLEVSEHIFSVGGHKGKPATKTMQVYRIDGNRTRARMAIERMTLAAREFATHMDRFGARR